MMGGRSIGDRDKGRNLCISKSQVGEGSSTIEVCSKLLSNWRDLLEDFNDDSNALVASVKQSSDEDMRKFLESNGLLELYEAASTHSLETSPPSSSSLGENSNCDKNNNAATTSEDQSATDTSLALFDAKNSSDSAGQRILRVESVGIKLTAEEERIVPKESYGLFKNSVVISKTKMEKLRQAIIESESAIRKLLELKRPDDCKLHEMESDGVDAEETVQARLHPFGGTLPAVEERGYLSDGQSRGGERPRPQYKEYNSKYTCEAVRDEERLQNSARGAILKRPNDEATVEIPIGDGSEASRSCDFQKRVSSYENFMYCATLSSHPQTSEKSKSRKPNFRRNHNFNCCNSIEEQANRPSLQCQTIYVDSKTKSTFRSDAFAESAGRGAEFRRAPGAEILKEDDMQRPVVVALDGQNAPVLNIEFDGVSNSRKSRQRNKNSSGQGLGAAANSSADDRTRSKRSNHLSARSSNTRNDQFLDSSWSHRNVQTSKKEIEEGRACLYHFSEKSTGRPTSSYAPFSAGRCPLCEEDSALRASSSVEEELDCFCEEAAGRKRSVLRVERSVQVGVLSDDRGSGRGKLGDGDLLRGCNSQRTCSAECSPSDFDRMISGGDVKLMMDRAEQTDIIELIDEATSGGLPTSRIQARGLASNKDKQHRESSDHQRKCHSDCQRKPRADRVYESGRKISQAIDEELQEIEPYIARLNDSTIAKVASMEMDKISNFLNSSRDDCTK